MIYGNYWLILYAVDEMIEKLSTYFRDNIFTTYRNEREIEEFAMEVRDDFFRQHPEYQKLQSMIRIDITTVPKSTSYHLHFEVDKFEIHKLI